MIKVLFSCGEGPELAGFKLELNKLTILVGYNSTFKSMIARTIVQRLSGTDVSIDAKAYGKTLLVGLKSVRELTASYEVDVEEERIECPCTETIDASVYKLAIKHHRFW